MNINELAKNDLVLYKDCQYSIDFINYDDETVDLCQNNEVTVSVDTCDISPIPITIKFLIKNGWEQIKKGLYYKDKIELAFRDKFFSIDVCGENYIFTYVHQLQHFINALGLESSILKCDEDYKSSLSIEFEAACNNYVREFIKKHEFDTCDAYWVGDDVGGIFAISDYFFDMDTIRIDIDENPDESELLEWYDYRLDAMDYGLITPNYHSWIHGCPRLSSEEMEIMAKAENIKNKWKS